MRKPLIPHPTRLAPLPSKDSARRSPRPACGLPDPRPPPRPAARLALLQASWAVPGPPAVRPSPAVLPAPTDPFLGHLRPSALAPLGLARPSAAGGADDSFAGGVVGLDVAAADGSGEVLGDGCRWVGGGVCGEDASPLHPPTVTKSGT